VPDNGLHLPETPVYLLFDLRGRPHAIGVEYIREIVPLPELTPVEEVPPEVVGVMNLRGAVIPVMDLALRLDFPPQPYNLDHCVMVVSCKERLWGLLVDNVERLVQILSTDVEMADRYHQDLPSPPLFLAGIGRLDDGLVPIIDLVNVISYAPLIQV